VLVGSQAAVIEELRGRVKELEGEVAELRARLGKNSRNSSRPPSSDGLAKPPTKSLRRPSGRKPGGQQGHPGHRLEQAAEPDEVITHVPERCAGCGADLSAAKLVGEEVRQVFELPTISLRVREHRAERRRCGCGELASAPFPEGVAAPTQYGPRLRALAVYLVAHQHLPYQRAAGLLADWLAAPLSTGTLHALVASAGAGLDEFCELVRARLHDEAVVGVDETGARAEGRTRWVHSASSSEHTLYRLHDIRGYAGIDELGVLPDYRGIAVHDGFKPYQRYAQADHALCNAHHLRELQGVIERDPEAQSWATSMDELLRELKDAVEQARRRGQSALRPKQLATFKRRYGQIIALGHHQSPPNTKRTGARGFIAQTPARNLLCRLDEHREQVLRFAEDARVPFDNNLAERDLRMVKLQQKISGSWRTIDGAQRFLALRSYISTTRKQGRDLLDALRRAVENDPWLPIAAEP
jgi:transposase